MASYTRFEDGDILISSEKVSTPIWTGNSSVITGSSSVTASNEGTFSSDFYLDVIPSSGSSEVQFSIAYADKDGSGSQAYNPAVVGPSSYSPSRTIYGQYRSLVLGDEESKFSFVEGVDSPNFWAISIDRARFKETLMVGSLTLVISGSGTGSAVILKDESSVNRAGSTRYLDSGRVYSIFGGPATYNTGSSSWELQSGSSWTEGYGFFLPDIGVLLLDCGLLASPLGTTNNENGIRFNNTAAASKDPYENAKLLLNGIQCFSLRAEETVTSNYIWVRAKNSQFNYSMNPSFITDTGEIRQDIMINSPETYITSVGLYNDANDLVAIAKLSRPLLKSFNREALIRIKLDY